MAFDTESDIQLHSTTNSLLYLLCSHFLLTTNFIRTCSELSLYLFRTYP